MINESNVYVNFQGSKKTKRTHLKGLREHLSNFLLAEGHESFGIALHLTLLLTTTRTRTSGTAKDLCLPPMLDSALRVGKAMTESGSARVHV